MSAFMPYRYFFFLCGFWYFNLIENSYCKLNFLKVLQSSIQLGFGIGCYIALSSFQIIMPFLFIILDCRSYQHTSPIYNLLFAIVIKYTAFFSFYMLLWELYCDIIL